jgi:hypothetical protein
MDAITASLASTMSMITVHFAGCRACLGVVILVPPAVAVAIPLPPYARFPRCALRHVTGSGPRPGG